MNLNLSKKAIDCLAVAERGGDGDPYEWRLRYDVACGKYSEKAVNKKMQELADRGYIECGVSARTGWLTQKGKNALAAHRAVQHV